MGIRHDATRKKLLQTGIVDLKGAIDICRASESATKQLRAMSKSENVYAFGIDACLQFDLLNVNTDNICAQNDSGSAFKTNNILDEFADVFEGCGKFEGTVSAKVDPSITPV
jgi:hypothetical protein